MMGEYPQAEHSGRLMLDMDGKQFKRHVAVIQGGIRALLNIYMGPRTGGRLQDLQADLNELVAEHYREGKRSG